ncbi:MAG: CDP-alcohol phosphatidyltransferase family protein [Candidatus Pacearchaeota archaeon]|nr:CDP-alcohol phosphatidyltransferase family protein [Candidatus Pacearchaeota archaeon]
MKKEKPKFDITKCCYQENTVNLARLCDPYTAKIARFVYDTFGISANAMTLITFIISIISLSVLFFVRTYEGLVISAILILIRNLTDTLDGKIARGTGTITPVGGFTDLITDWLFYHAAFFIIVGYLTDNIFIGFLCVTGYMSREFARRKFTEKYGNKITEVSEAKKIPFVVSVVKKYNLGEVTILTPLALVLIPPVWIIYFVAFMEYSLLLAELSFDYYCFFKKKNEKIEFSAE